MRVCSIREVHLELAQLFQYFDQRFAAANINNNKQQDRLLWQHQFTSNLNWFQTSEEQEKMRDCGSVNLIWTASSTIILLCLHPQHPKRTVFWCLYSFFDSCSCALSFQILMQHVHQNNRMLHSDCYFPTLFNFNYSSGFARLALGTNSCCFQFVGVGGLLVGTKHSSRSSIT